MGLNLMASKGNLPAAIGTSGLAGVNAYNQTQQTQRQQALQALQMQQARQGIDTGKIQLNEAQRRAEQEATDRMLTQGALTPVTGLQAIGAGQSGPTPAAAQLVGQQPRFDPWNFLQSGGSIEGAKNVISMQQAAMKPVSKAMKTEPMVDPATNKLVNVTTFEDGSTRVLPFGVKPDMVSTDTGGKITWQDKNALLPGASIAKTVTPGELLSSQTSIGNNRATIAGENLRAGFGANGQPLNDIDITAQAIADGRLPPPSGMALTSPKNQRILTRVMELNPNYDFTTVTAKKNAAAAFATGNQGNALRSFATGLDHLDQLGGLVTALGNGDNATRNLIGNKVSTWNGATPVTNFDAAKDIVSKEIVKAIVGAGGGVGEREEIAKLLDSAKSPKQLNGVIAQFKGLMQAQHDNLLAQRRAAGLPDSTIPNYSPPGGHGLGSGAFDFSKADAILGGGR
jgi:hypothetical protein